MLLDDPLKHKKIQVNNQINTDRRRQRVYYITRSTMKRKAFMKVVLALITLFVVPSGECAIITHVFVI